MLQLLGAAVRPMEFLGPLLLALPTRPLTSGAIGFGAASVLAFVKTVGIVMLISMHVGIALTIRIGVHIGLINVAGRVAFLPRQFWSRVALGPMGPHW